MIIVIVCQLIHGLGGPLKVYQQRTGATKMWLNNPHTVKNDALHGKSNYYLDINMHIRPLKLS